MFPRFSSKCFSSSFASRRFYHALIDIHPQVQEALHTNKPIVALESVIITHGFDHSISPTIALSLENIVRSTGAVPATIAILDGRIKIGLEQHQLTQLLTPSAVKISRRDIGPAIALKATGGTTVCSTSIFASLVGIKVFSTGGLGGVHRGGESSMDISADLTELARTPIAVVSAGVKSILDIGRTLEYLETLGVPVVAYSKTHDFPAFFAPKSGFQVPWHSDCPNTVASMLHAQWELGLKNGALIAAPIPSKFEAQATIIQNWVEQAVVESEENGVSKLGKEATPWLLKRVAELSQGKSRESNVALLENTARIGAQIAVEYHKISGGKSVSTVLPLSTSPKEILHHENPITNVKPQASPSLVVVGSSAIDLTSQSSQAITPVSNAMHTTVPGTVSLSFGGVARNIGEAAHRMLDTKHPGSVVLVTPSVDDPFGRMLTAETSTLGMRTDGFIPCDSKYRTAVCNMFLDQNGNLLSGVADMSVCESLRSEEVESKVESLSPRIICLDGNLHTTILRDLIIKFKDRSTLVFEPTSISKSKRIMEALANAKLSSDEPQPIHVATPNILELKEMYRAAQDLGLTTSSDRWWRIIESFKLGTGFRLGADRLGKLRVSDSSSESLNYLSQEGIITMAIHLLPFVRHLIVKLGSHGALLVQHCPPGSFAKHDHGNVPSRTVVVESASGTVLVRHFPPIQVQSIVNVTGVGDSFVGAVLARLYLDPGHFDDPAAVSRTIDLAQQAAILTLQSTEAVGKGISKLLISA